MFSLSWDNTWHVLGWISVVNKGHNKVCGNLPKSIVIDNSWPVSGGLSLPTVVCSLLSGHTLRSYQHFHVCVSKGNLCIKQVLIKWLTCHHESKSELSVSYWVGLYIKTLPFQIIFTF